MKKYKSQKKIFLYILVIKISVAILFIIYFVNLVLVQLKFNFDYSVNGSSLISTKNQIDDLYSPTRGNFYDFEYTKLTDSLNEYVIYLDYFRLIDIIKTYKPDEISNYISNYTNVDVHFINQKIQESLEKKVNIEIKKAKIIDINN